MPNLQFQPGEIVLLKKEPRRPTAKKRRPFLKKRAKVLDCPPNGVWMKVLPLVEDPSSLTWKKSCVMSLKGRMDPSKALDGKTMHRIFSFLLPTIGVNTVTSLQQVSYRFLVLTKVSPRWKMLAMSGRMDPSSVLDDNVMALIFSFLGHGDGGGDGNKDLQDVIETHALLSIVCKKWRAIYLDHISRILGLLEANLLDKHSLEETIEWMCRHKLRLEMVCFCPYSREVPLLLRLLRACDTSNLKYACVGLSTWSCRPRSEPILQEQTRLFESLSQECPMLESLSLTVILTRGQTERVPPNLSSLPLFSMASIKRVCLHFTCFGNPVSPRARAGITNEFFESLVSGLVSIDSKSAFTCGPAIYVGGCDDIGFLYGR